MPIPLVHVWRVQAFARIAAIGPNRPMCDAILEGNQSEAEHVILSVFY